MSNGPSPSSWTRTAARHLLNRAGFGGTPDEVTRLHALGPGGAVDALLRGVDDSAQFPVDAAWSEPTDRLALFMQARGADQEKRREMVRSARRSDVRSLVELASWWTRRMRETTYPLREKMTLFWHGHFATSYIKVRSAYLMYQQNALFREYGLGDVRELTRAITRDGAMVRWLDLHESTKENPNENFARELFELFTLGEGNYSEQDIREAARAFTGYQLNRRYQTFQYQEPGHDAGEKLIFGRRGNWTGDDVVEMALSRPESATFLTTKIWRFFAGEEAPLEVVPRLAAAFRAGGYRVDTLLREIFSSAEFYRPEVIGRQIKSPIQWLVQTTRELETDLPRFREQRAIFQELGQVPFLPPNVKGWDGGRTWINASTLLARYNHAGELLDQSRRSFLALVPEEDRADPARTVAALQARFYVTPPPPEDQQKFEAFAREQNAGRSPSACADLIRLMLSTPFYQLT